MANTQKALIREKQREMNALIAAAQERIKAKLYAHGMRKKVSSKTGLSAYKIREALKAKNSRIETLEIIENALKSAA